MKRRTFLKNTSLVSGAFLVPSFLKAFELLPMGALKNKTLVVVQLSGGNDGLNTIVPFTNDLYYNARPSLAVKSNEVIKLNDALGLNPAMQSLQEIYDQGWMTIINNVGYPNPNRSHFRATDIWHTASDAHEYLNTGWLGRYLDSNCSTCKNAHNAIEVGEALSLALKGNHKNGLAIEDPKKLFLKTQQPFLKDMIQLAQAEHLSEDNMGYLYKTLIETSSSADYIYETTKTYDSKATYPQNAFANKLKRVATFINSGLNSKVYYVSLSGFDTHANQTGGHERLLQMFSDGMQAFLKDLKQNDNLDNTLVLCFSEFGRRVEQNGSKGTDHGTANNLFLFGGNLKKPGFYNEGPDLSNLDKGDLKYKIDFRNVYASILDGWLEVDSKTILNNSFKGLGLV